MVKANTFILGAPKCGTTSLSSWLGQHPEIFASNPKEPHYFYSPYGKRMSENEYESLFDKAEGHHKIRLESSVWYLFFAETAVTAIEEECLNAKYIVCLRNPLDMAPSLHNQKVYSGHEQETRFEVAWRLSPERRKGHFLAVKDLPPDADVKHMDYQEACLLGRQVSRLLNIVDRERVCFVFVEDMEYFPKETIERVFSFLGVTPCNSIDFQKKNIKKPFRHPVLRRAVRHILAVEQFMNINVSRRLYCYMKGISGRLNDTSKTKESMKSELRRWFHNDVLLLSELTGRDLSHWVKGN